MAAKDFFSTRVQRARRFHLESVAGGGTRVVSGGWELVRPDYEIRRPDFPFMGIEYVAQGAGELTLLGRTHRLAPGSIFSYGPGVPHEIRTDRALVLGKYFVDFTGIGPERLLAEAGLRGGRVLQVTAPERVRAIFEDLIATGARQSAFAGRICMRILEHLLLALCESAVPHGTLEAPAFTTYVRCRRHLEDHALRLRSLAVAAAQCGVSAAYLCRLFRRFDRQSPFQLLTRLRMAEAARRLDGGTDGVAAVAAAVGFPDQFHFSRVFKRVYGASPQGFKRLRAGAR